MAFNLPFVKFQRGTQAQYDRLKQGNRLEDDALYFIYDSAAPENGGLLYMGDVLIGGTGSAVGASALNDLSDVDLSGITLLDGMILQYNSLNSVWEPVRLSELLPGVNTGTKSGTQTDSDVLTQVDPTPTEGDIVFVDGKPYIYDGSSWQTLVGQNLEDRVAALETQMQAVDGKIATAISTANHLTYSVVGTLPASPAPNTIYLVGDGTKTGDDKYEEWMLISNNGVSSLEKIGNFAPNLNDYVTTTTFNTAITDLNSSISGLQNNLNNYVLINTYDNEIGDIADLRTKVGDNSATIVDTLSEVYDSVVWHAMT